MVKLFKLRKNILMNYKILVNQVYSNIFRLSEKIESRNAWLIMRDSLEKLNDR